MSEIWKSIKGYEGLYEVSNFGRVRCLNYSDWRVNRTDGGVRKLNDVNGDYLRVTLSSGKRKYKTFLVHKLVVGAFIGDVPKGMDINHKDGNKKNNFAENLEIVTKKQNTQHAILTGLFDVAGEKNPMAKLSDEKIKEIRKELTEKKKMKKDIASSFGISAGYLWCIETGKKRA